MSKMPSVMFVCLGNICRSPAAEGILRKQASELVPPFSIHVESSGIGDWFVGRQPDQRMREAALLRGFNLNSRAQQFRMDFFEQFDYILVADIEVLSVLKRYAHGTNHQLKIHLMTAFSHQYRGEEVPDPYYFGTNAFERVLDILEESCRSLLEHLQQEAKCDQSGK